MKKVIFAIMALASLSSFANEEITITNKTYPENKILIHCDKVQCESLTMSFIYQGEVIVKSAITADKIRSFANKRIKVKFDTDLIYMYTRQNLQEVKKNSREGYYGAAVGSGIVSGITGIGETILLPLAGLAALSSAEREYPRSFKKSAQLILETMDSDKSEIELKEKSFVRLRDYLLNIGTIIVDTDSIVDTYIKSPVYTKDCIKYHSKLPQEIYDRAEIYGKDGRVDWFERMLRNNLSRSYHVGIYLKQGVFHCLK